MNNQNTKQIETLQSLMERKGLKFGEYTMVAYLGENKNILGSTVIGVLVGDSRSGVICIGNPVMLYEPVINEDFGKKIPNIDCSHNCYAHNTRISDLSEEVQIYSEAEIAPRLREDPIFSFYASLFEDIVRATPT